jgi:hypothetical protein
MRSLATGIALGAFPDREFSRVFVDEDVRKLPCRMIDSLACVLESLDPVEPVNR